MNTNPTPIIKWAGGKRQLVERLSERAPQNYGSYYEPFFGGGALFFHLLPEHAHINDINESLINLYLKVRDDHTDFLQTIESIDNDIPQDKGLAKEQYYELRARYNELILSDTYTNETAALLLYLNKHCFNGLYRVNSKGAFNVPFNGSVRPSCSSENIENVSEALQNVSITCDDFEASVQNAKAGDFVFFDSPYAPLNETSFEAYTKEGFLKEDHERLAELFRALDKKGCYVMLTNHNTNLINQLYDGYKIEVVQVKRAINSDATKRKGTEVIITNYLD